MVKPEIDENGRTSDPGFFTLTQPHRPIAEMIVLNPSTTIALALTSITPM